MANGYDFTNRISKTQLSTVLAGNMLAELDVENKNRLTRLPTFWNFYEGYHWEGIEEGDKPQTTKNYCRRFVDKFVAAEFNGGISFNFANDKVEEKVLPFLNEVWNQNQPEVLLLSVGQFKSVTGDGFIHIHYEPKTINGQLNPNLDDPFDEFPLGKIFLFSVPSSVCFPEYEDGYDISHSSMKRCTIMYPVSADTGAFASSSAVASVVLMKHIYTKTTIEIWRGATRLSSHPNDLGIIPIVHLPNLILGTSRFGIPDLEDLIPLNVELNMKDSDVSEILDYHSAPITVVYGAKVSQLERGANKIWGGLPKDSKVENLELKSDMSASDGYRKDIKLAMNQIKGMPEIALGGENIASNVSGIALQIAFMPLVDTINMKRTVTKEALKLVNKIILKYALTKEMLEAGDFGKDIYAHEVVFQNILPKDLIQEIELLEREFKIGLESRRGALERLHRDNIEEKIKEVDADKEENPSEYGLKPVILGQGQKLVSIVNGEVIAEVEPAPVATPASGGKVGGKEVGMNKEGQPMKTISGLTNKNPTESHE